MAVKIKGQKGRLNKINKKTEKEILTVKPADQISSRKMIGMAMITLNQIVDGVLVNGDYSVNSVGEITPTETIETKVEKKEPVEDFALQLPNPNIEKFFNKSFEVNPEFYSQRAFDLGGNQGGIAISFEKNNKTYF